MTSTTFTSSLDEKVIINENPSGGLTIFIERKSDHQACNDKALYIILTNASIPGIVGKGLTFDMNEIRDEKLKNTNAKKIIFDENRFDCLFLMMLQKDKRARIIISGFLGLPPGYREECIKDYLTLRSYLNSQAKLPYSNIRGSINKLIDLLKKDEELKEFLDICEKYRDYKFEELEEIRKKMIQLK